MSNKLTLALGQEVSSPRKPFSFTDSGTFKEGDLAIGSKGMRVKGESPKLIVSASTTTSDASGTPPRPPFSLTDFKILKSLGSGAGGVVKKALHIPSNYELALKVMTLDVSDAVRKQIITELKTLYLNQSEYVVAFYDAFFTEGSIYIALEYMDGGSLADIIAFGPMDERTLAHISVQVLKGLSYLQSLRIVHRDIKPSNILVNMSGKIKIADFGVSSQLTSTRPAANTWVGTVTYMSPERINGKSYSYNSDIWSLGLTLAEAALGRYPYSTDMTNPSTGQPIPFFELLAFVLKSPAPTLPSDQFSPEFCSFIEACLQKDPEQRLNAADLLSHPFIVQHMYDEEELSRWLLSRLPQHNDHA